MDDKTDWHTYYLVGADVMLSGALAWVAYRAKADSREMRGEVEAAHVAAREARGRLLAIDAGIFRDGQEARQRGWAQSDNPYKDHTLQMLWQRGWDLG